MLQLLRKKDLLCLFPTGAGKSICFQLPAMIFPGLTIVVSPLIALMNDQVRHLKEHNIPAECLNSLQSPEEARRIMQSVFSHSTKLLYVSPERLMQPSFVASMQKTEISMVVVDEAHCIIQWGDDFRVSYTKIGDFIRSLQRRPVICAMTATADRNMCLGIIKSLSMVNPKVLTLPLLRENLSYRIVPTMGKNREIIDIIRSHPMQKGVIFASTRRRTEEIAGFLSCQDLPVNGVGYYHAGMTRDQRDAAQQMYTSGKYTVLATTSAFGMGVDIPDIRYIIHDSFPEDMVDYVQQSGRAGRDGLQSECTVLMDVADIEKMCHTLQRIHRSKDMSGFQRASHVNKIWSKEKEALTWAMSGECLCVGLMRIFSQEGKPCGKCSACLSANDSWHFSEVPNLLYLDREGVCKWALGWQRVRLANTLGTNPGKVLDSGRLSRLSQGVLLTNDDTGNDFVRARMNSVVNHMKNA